MDSFRNLFPQTEQLNLREEITQLEGAAPETVFKVVVDSLEVGDQGLLGSAGGAAVQANYWRLCLVDALNVLLQFTN